MASLRLDIFVLSEKRSFLVHKKGDQDFNKKIPTGAFTGNLRKTNVKYLHSTQFSVSLILEVCFRSSIRILSDASCVHQLTLTVYKILNAFDTNSSLKVRCFPGYIQSI